MKFFIFRVPIAAAVLVVVSGCATTMRIPDRGRLPEAKDPWAQVLRDHVHDQGQTDFRSLKKDPALLTEAARRVGKRKLEDLQTDEELLTYYINGYNTLAMYLAVTSGHRPEQKIRFFVLTKINVAGEYMSLYQLENDVIRPLGEPRIHFALNCMVKDCPRLPNVPFRAETLDAQLQQAAEEFLNSEKHIRVEHKTKTVSLSPIMKWYREDFETPDQTLLDYINRYRDDAIPDEFKIKWLPYDWTLNQVD